MTQDDQILELIRRASCGDRASFEVLVERCRNRLEEFVGSRIRPQLKKQLSVEELVNETFARAFESLGRFEGTTEDGFLGWLAGIAKHVVLKEVDRLQRGKAMQLDREPSDVGPSPSKVLRRDERFDRLQKAINSMCPDYREVILLCRIDGLPIKDAAERMNRSPDAVKKLLWRALKELKSRFGETESLHLPDRSLGKEEERNGG